MHWSTASPASAGRPGLARGWRRRGAGSTSRREGSTPRPPESRPSSSSTSTKATRNRPIWLNTEPTWRSGRVAPKTRWRSWCKRSTYWPDRMTPGLWPAFWCWVCAPVGTWNPEREPFRQLTGGEELRSSSPCHDSCDPAWLAQPRRPAPDKSLPGPRASRGGRPARHSGVRGLQDQYRPIWITVH